MWKKIVNPKTGIKINVNSKIGKNVLRNYIKQLGGAESAEDTEVVVRVYEGVTYYLDEKTNELYNEMDQLVGTWDAENNKPILSSEEEVQIAFLKNQVEEMSEENAMLINQMMNSHQVIKEGRKKDEQIALLKKELLQHQGEEKIMELVGEDLYDYSDIETYELEDVMKITHFARYGQPPQPQNLNNIIKEEGEKIILYFTSWHGHGNNSSDPFMNLNLITNYGTIYHMSRYNGQYKTSLRKEFIKRYEYWIPKDYINILKYMIWGSETYTLNNDIQTHIDYINLDKVLEHIKENLYNGRYVKNNVDIHYMDVYIEKQRMIEEQERFEINKNEKEIELETAMNKLEEERKMFEIKKAQLKRISQKLKTEKQNIDKQKEELEKLLLTRTTIDDLFDALEEE